MLLAWQLAHGRFQDIGAYRCTVSDTYRVAFKFMPDDIIYVASILSIYKQQPFNNGRQGALESAQYTKILGLYDNLAIDPFPCVAGAVT
jgi:hypothetical protein